METVKLYRVEFAIDVEADTPEEACRLSWSFMTGPESMLPVGTVLEFDGGEPQNVDLQALAERETDGGFDPNQKGKTS